MKRFAIVFEGVISGSAGGVDGLSGELGNGICAASLCSAIGSHDPCSNRVISSEMTDEPKPGLTLARLALVGCVFSH